MGDLLPPVVPAGALGVGPQPTLTGGALTLLPWGPRHVEDLLLAYQDPAIRRWHVQSLSRDEARDYPAAWAALWSTSRRVGWAVERHGALAGRVTLSRIDTEAGQAEVTYWVLPAARGTGVMPGAVQAVCDWAYGVGFHRLELCHSVHNLPSCRVAEKTGFRLEGTRRRQGLHEDGWHDMHLHARLATDPPAPDGTCR